MADIMLDLETLGTAPGCVIRSIGAVDFDPSSSETGAAFYVIVDRASCEAAGLTVDAATEAWWSEQSAEARAEFESQGVPLAEALDQFDAFYRQHAPVEAKTDRLWCNGPSFDETILAAAYRALGRKTPWRYNAARDCRTIYDLNGLKLQHTAGTFHKAIDDAVEQAKLVQEAYRLMFGGQDTADLSEAEREDLTKIISGIRRSYLVNRRAEHHFAGSRKEVLERHPHLPPLVRSALLSGCVEYSRQVEIMGGKDKVLNLRVVAREFLASAAFIEQSMARKHGYHFDAASYALTAHAIADEQYRTWPTEPLAQGGKVAVDVYPVERKAR